MGSRDQSAFNDNISIASLETINFASLERKDAMEINKLLDASKKAGFFYLDFAGSGAKNLPKKKQELLKIMDQYFLQPLDTKMVDSRGKSTRGYVSGGTFSGVDRQDPKQSFEHLALSSYELLRDPSKTLPLLFQDAGSLVKDYISICEHVVDVMLAPLSEALGLERELHLTKNHHHDRQSAAILALLSYAGKLTHQKHTDLGSLTVLFSDQWSLQVVAPQTGQWEWVEPRKSEAVINVGDTLRFFSGKKLFSCVHRVVREGRAGEEGHRYSIAYLLRPDDDAVLTMLTMRAQRPRILSTRSTILILLHTTSKRRTLS